MNQKDLKNKIEKSGIEQWALQDWYLWTELLKLLKIKNHQAKESTKSITILNNSEFLINLL